MAIDRAKEEGNSYLVLQLKIGGVLREKCGLTCCDRLKLEEDSNEVNSSSNGNGHTNDHDLSNDISSSAQMDDGESKDPEHE